MAATEDVLKMPMMKGKDSKQSEDVNTCEDDLCEALDYLRSAEGQLKGQQKKSLQEAIRLIENDVMPASED